MTIDHDATDGSPPPAAEPDWEDPPGRTAPDAAPTLSVEGFEGPLDFLVEQCRAGRIDLARLSIAALVDAFGEALAARVGGTDKRSVALARWGSWLVMAADLALLRSRLLLPADDGGGPAAGLEAEELRHRILRRAGNAAAADWLERRNQLGRDVWGRGQGETGGPTGRTGGITDLLRACLMALQLPDGAEAVFRVALPTWSVADTAARIRAMLRELGEDGAPLERFLPEVEPGGPYYELRCRAAVASTFGTGLEMVRDGTVCATQETVPNGTITLRVRSHR